MLEWCAFTTLFVLKSTTYFNVAVYLVEYSSIITPIPKTQQVSVEEDLRPVSLTPCLSNVLEDFVVRWVISAVGDKINPQQFGCLKGSSTTFCLLDMVHNWLQHLDIPGQYLRASFLDFSKAFDRINHNIVIQKLITLWCPSVTYSLDLQFPI